jgi:hypothetical protein
VRYAPAMPRLHPNPPRLVTVGIAVALLVVGTVLALPIPAAVNLLDPLTAVVAPFGLALDASFGYLCLFAGNALLIAGSLLPGI